MTSLMPARLRAAAAWDTPTPEHLFIAADEIELLEQDVDELRARVTELERHLSPRT